MTPSNLTDDNTFAVGTIAKLAAGFALGLAMIPLLIMLTAPRPDEVSDIAFFEAPREARLALYNEVAAIDRYDERALVGTSIVALGFANPRDSRAAHFGLSFMRVEEALGLIENLLNRSRPPKTIIVDWTALNEAPPEFFGVSQTPSLYSLDYLSFSLRQRFSNGARPEPRANATWEHPGRQVDFDGNNFDRFLKRVARFERYSRPKKFANALSSMCADSQTRFVIVRFPIYLGGDKSKARDYIASQGAIDYDKLLTFDECSIEFVDFFAESVSGEGNPPAHLTSTDQWYDFYHFRPVLGETLLNDPRLSGVETTSPPASSSTRKIAVEGPVTALAFDSINQALKRR